MEVGFTKADSRNLPEVNVDMVIHFFIESAEFSSVEMKGTKLLRSTRESYGDNAIGYVQIKRDGELCTVKSRVTPEHKVRKQGYRVTTIINEMHGLIQSCRCEDCAASEGGCKHAAALLLWLHRRSEEPSTTSITCYWKKSKLSTCASGKSFIKAKEIGHIPVTNSFSQVDILNEFLDAVKKKDCEASIIRYFPEDQKTISIHKLCSGLVGKLDSPQSFLEILSREMTTDNINMIFSTTKRQSDSPLWFELRYGRITGSTLYEAAHCTTKNGSLLNKIMGEQSKFTSFAMDRGKKLEKEVLKIVAKKEKIKIEEAGLLLNAEYPIFGVTPDGLTENYTVEVKCPSTDATILSYVKDNKIRPKFWTQVQLQMFFSKRKMAIFCVAQPNFEQSKQVDLYYVPFDNSIVSVLDAAMKFWIDVVFPKLKDIYNI